VERDERWWLGPLHLFGYLGVSVAWMVLLGVGLVLLAVLNPDLFGTITLDDLAMPDSPDFVGIVSLFTIVQLVGMAMIAAVGAVFVPLDGSMFSRVRRNLGMVSARWVALPLVIGIGLAGGLFPSWVIEQLGDALPGFSPIVDTLVTTALQGPAATKVAITLAVAVAAPVCEELVFRGYLWAALERYLSAGWAFVVTSLVFAFYHLDPAQVVGVLPIGFALGWARWRTGSVWPSMVLHATNNTLALAVAAAGPEIAQLSTPLWLGLSGLGVTLACCVGLLWAGPPAEA
jgi:membrane protease YdiL (CAAX protease family)